MTKEDIIEIVRQRDHAARVTRDDLYAGLAAYEDIFLKRVKDLERRHSCFIQNLFVRSGVATDSGFVNAVKAIRAIAE